MISESTFLKRTAIFSGLSYEELKTISIELFEKTYHKGTTLFFQNMKAEVMYVIRSGLIRIVVHHPGEPDQALAELGPGNFLGEMSILEEEPRSATARVVEDSVLVYMTRKSFANIMNTYPAIGNKILMAIIRVLSSRLRNANEKIHEPENGT